MQNRAILSEIEAYCGSDGPWARGVEVPRDIANQRWLTAQMRTLMAQNEGYLAQRHFDSNMWKDIITRLRDTVARMETRVAQDGAALELALEVYPDLRNVPAIVDACAVRDAWCQNEQARILARDRGVLGDNDGRSFWGDSTGAPVDAQATRDAADSIPWAPYDYGLPHGTTDHAD